MGVCAVSSKGHITKSRLSHNQRLNNPNASCSGKPQSRGETSHPVAALSTAGSSGHRSGLAEPLRERKIFAVFLIC